MQLASDNRSYRYPVSIKGVVSIDGKIPLLKNERDEFELPGGKLELTENPVECVVREIKEELNIDVEVIGILDSWLYHINPTTHVVIITYACRCLSNSVELKLSNEHKELRLFEHHEISNIIMPQGYKDSINNFYKNLIG